MYFVDFDDSSSNMLLNWKYFPFLDIMEVLIFYRDYIPAVAPVDL